MSDGLADTLETRTLRKGQRSWAWFVRFATRIEVWGDRLVWGLRRRWGKLGPLQVVAYRSFGTLGMARVRGRVLEASVLERSLPQDTRWRSFRRTLRRFNSREVPDVTVRATAGSASCDSQTDDEGYFDVTLATEGGSSDWQSVRVSAIAAPVRGLSPVHATADVLIPLASAEVGVISDIDDTVLQTHVTQKLKMIGLTLFGNAFTRMPFEGTSELYRALVAGKSGQANNPVFYVSKSPWNLYDFLIDFMDYHQLPRGPLLLRDIGLHEAPPLDHKTAAVQQLFDTYPALSFVLIGDSGERDAEIYVGIAARYPGRVRAIYIRDLGGKTARRDRQSLRERASGLGTPLLWVAHAREALEHARESGTVG